MNCHLWKAVRDSEPSFSDGCPEVSHRITPFVPYGYDERQYCSPGFDLPVGGLMRTPNGEYPEYHSSADNLSLLLPESLAHSLAVLRRVVDVRRTRRCLPRPRRTTARPAGAL